MPKKLGLTLELAEAHKKSLNAQRVARHYKTEKGKATLQKYQQSDKGKAVQERYLRGKVKLKMIEGIRLQAIANNIPIDFDYLKSLEATTCPIAGTPLKFERPMEKLSAKESAVFDLVVPELGYVSGNVRIISKWAKEA